MKISVIIPVYNEQKYITNCLNGLIDQDVIPDEIIVVDNNCTDKTIEIVNEYKNIKVISEKNQGIAYARNAGFKAVKVDADTVLTKQYIRNLKNVFASNKTIAYVSDFIFKDVFILKYSRISSILFQFFFRIFFGYNALIGPAFAIRKSIWTKVKDKLCVDDNQAHEDIDLSIHISSVGKIYYDQNTIVYISGRRMKFNPLSFFIEYPVIFLKMLGSHRSKLNK